MKKGICFYFGFLIPTEERVKMIKEAGFDCVIACADPHFNKQNGTIKKQISLFKKYGLELSSLHMRYKQEDLPLFWTKSLKGYKQELALKKDIKVAHKYGFKEVVVHLEGECSQVGINRLKRVLKLCHKLNVPLAVENLEDNRALFYVFENISDDYLKFCWDCGHNNAFSKEIDFPTQFKDKLVCLHLHDNDGKEDLHTLNKYGTINWNEIAKKLATFDNDIVLDYEILMHYREKEDNARSVLAEVYEQAVELEKNILKYKKG